MTHKKALQIIKEQWDRKGFCNSCGYHGSFEADYFPDSYTVNKDKQRIELACASGNDDHRGVYIYYKNEEE